jgi:hypothetical protein
VQSIPHVIDVVVTGPAGPLDLVIEVPHGATTTADYDHHAARLASPLPPDLIDFFHVNTDSGAPELATAVARALPDRAVAVLRSRIPRTFIDCNRRMDASPADFKAGKLTPGLMPWIEVAADRALLRAAYDTYVDAVDDAISRLSSRGAILLLHTYAPRTVDVEVGPEIVNQLHAAYAADRVTTWPLRPAFDVISRDPDGTDHAPTAVVDALRAAVAPHDVAASATYPLHPSSLAYDRVVGRPGRVLCLEVRRDLLGAFDPFAEKAMDPVAVDRIGAGVATALRRWW